ncbi:MAG TPA: hypothetical protein VFS83_18575 [Ktedonobacterales bacterium]|nr:hypothetical protein [Ktedonobacterales bacterium]
MPATDIFHELNEFVLAALIFLLLIGAGEIGYLLARRLRAGRKNGAAAETHEHLNEIQTAIFAVLGLLLAFIFAMAVSRFDARKQALVDETDAIGTAYLRVQLLPPGQQAAAAAVFRTYVDARLSSARPYWYQDVRLKNETNELQQQLWTQGTDAANQDPHAVTTSLYIQSLNDMFDAQSARDAARLNELPTSAIYLVLAISILSMGTLGYRAGLGGRRSLVGAVLLALVITLVVGIIIELDQPYQGFITISQQSMIELRQSMGP